MKIWIFDDPFNKKGPILVIWLPGCIQPFTIVKVIEATEVVEAVEAIEAGQVLRPGKSLYTSESSRFLNSDLF